MTRTLLIGTSFSAAPLLSALKRKGHHVTVCGGFKSDPCHAYADASLYIDYSSPEALLEAVQKGEFDYIVPSCNDYSYLSGAVVASECGFLGFDTLETTGILHDKSKFRAFMGSNGFPVPRSFRTEEIERGQLSDLTFPLLVKPTDSFSGRGVTKITCPEKLPEALEAARNASRSGSATVEEFVEGTLHSHSAFVRAKKIAVDFFVDEFCTVYPYQVNCSNHPSALSDTVRATVRSVMDRMIKALDLTDGLLHTQFMVNGDRVWIIECMRRAPGDLYGQFVGWSTGIDYADLFVRPFIGEDLPAAMSLSEPRFMGRHTISTKAPVIVADFSYNIPAQTVRIIPLKSSGEQMDPAPFDKLAILFAEFNDCEEMLAISPYLDKYVAITPLELGIVHD